jgi:hypothetical protein
MTTVSNKANTIKTQKNAKAKNNTKKQKHKTIKKEKTQNAFFIRT